MSPATSIQTASTQTASAQTASTATVAAARTYFATQRLTPAMVRWQKLVELGLPVSEAKAFSKAIAQYYAMQQAKSRQQSLQARELIPVYWRRLIEVGMPINAARLVAEAIAWLDIAQKPLTRPQKKLIGQYCVLVCRAELWRSGMLLESDA